VAFFAPEPLSINHEIEDFTSGVAARRMAERRAIANQASGASRTFVLCETNKVVGYYALASGAVTVASATGRFRRNMPDPIPVVVLARLAIDQDHQGRVGRISEN
jgi:hypothetical protein